MPYTSHGHHIPGTISTVTPPPMGVKRCGGPGICTTCSADAYRHDKLKDVAPTELQSGEKKTLPTVKPRTFQRKPFEVEAVQITDENFDEVAIWCGGSIVTVEDAQESLMPVAPRRYISVDVSRPLSRRQTEAHVGDWILYASKGFKVYANRPFCKNFEKKPLDGIVEYATVASDE